MDAGGGRARGRRADDRGAEAAELERSRACQQALCSAGFGAMTYPSEYGGQGLGIQEQIEFNEEATAYNLPLSELVVGLGVCAPTLLALGTDEQKARYLRPLLHAEEIWCQLFSEPGAGSDVASLVTRAVGDAASGWTVDGQKVWTSGAHNADFGLLLARTDPTAERKHAGLTMFIVDMTSPGITVRPLRQMDGTAHFNEVFFDGVHVSAGHLVGRLNEGWAAALVSLMSERVNLGTTRATAGMVPDAETLIGRRPPPRPRRRSGAPPGARRRGYPRARPRLRRKADQCHSARRARTRSGGLDRQAIRQRPAPPSGGRWCPHPRAGDRGLAAGVPPPIALGAAPCCSHPACASPAGPTRSRETRWPNGPSGLPR